MNATQLVLQQLQELREALNAAGASSQGGWMNALYSAVESAHVCATGEAVFMQQAENTAQE